MDEISGMPGSREQNLEKEALSDRREFVTKAGKVALAVPAVALLLSLKAKSAHAVQAISGSPPPVPG